MLTRRRALLLFGAAAAAALTGSAAPTAQEAPLPAPVDLSSFFARFQVADEPDADPAKVVWPAWMDRQPAEVKRLYEFQLVNGGLMKYMPCFCGCSAEDGHRNNRDCYVEEVRPDGSVVFDTMAPTWDVCLSVTRAVMQMKVQGVPPRAIRGTIDAIYADQMRGVTPTPYPPAWSS